jgi:hypothetical protein
LNSDEKCAHIIRKSFYVKSEWNKEIWQNFLLWRVYVTKITNYHLLGLNPSLCSTWRICRDSPCHIAILDKRSKAKVQLACRIHQQAVWLTWGVYTFRYRQSCPSTSCVTYVRSVHVQTQTVLPINKLCDLREECTRSDTDSLPFPESAVGSPSSFSASTSDRPASRWGFCATAEGATAPVNKWNAEFKSGIHFTPANVFYTSKESKMRLGYGGQPINGIYGNNRSLVWESLEVWKFTVLAKFSGFYVTEAVTCSYHCCRNG